MAVAMYRALFQNSKVALGFVAVTILGAVSMVGTSDNSGLLLRAASLVGGVRSDTAGTPAAASASEAPPPSVFGDYEADEGVPAATGSTTFSGSGQTGNPMTAPIAPNAVVTQGGTATSDGYVSDSELEPAPE